VRDYTVTQYYRALPKLELHLHLDACARPATLRALATERGLPPPADDEVIAPPLCEDLRLYPPH
jgi:adenosine deaminase